MAARLGLSGHDQLQHFIANPAWDDGPLRQVLAREADRLVGGPGAALVTDDTALPKKGYGASSNAAWMVWVSVEGGGMRGWRDGPGPRGGPSGQPPPAESLGSRPRDQVDSR